MTMTALIRASSRTGAMTALTYRAFLRLAEERGGDMAAMEWLLKQATRAQAPICVNAPTTRDPLGPSTTFVVPPKGWSPERVGGWVGARHQELEETFGPAERVYGPKAS